MLLPAISDNQRITSGGEVRVSFKIVSSFPENLDRAVRKATRDAISSMHIMDRAVEDIRALFPKPWKKIHR